MSTTPKTASEVISPALRKVIAALMQKMEKNLKEHYAAELSSLRSELNLLKVKVTQLEKDQKKGSHLPLATAMTLGSSPSAKTLAKMSHSSSEDGSSHPVLSSSESSGAVTASGGLSASERAKRKAEWRLKKQRTTTFTVGANDLEADIAARRQARTASEADSAAAAAIVASAKARVGLPPSLMDERKESGTKLSADERATRDALKSLLKSSSERNVFHADSPDASSGGPGGLSLSLASGSSSTDSAGPKSPKSGAMAIITPTAQETIALLSLDIASDTDDEDPVAVARSLPSGLRSVPTAASVARRRKQSTQPRKRTMADRPPKKGRLAGTGKKTGSSHSKAKSYRAPRTSFAHIDQIYIGNRYALTDGRWGICKYYDPKSDTLGIELEMGLGEKSSVFKGKERWPLTGGAHACFISRKKVESDCGRP